MVIGKAENHLSIGAMPAVKNATIQIRPNPNVEAEVSVAQSLIGMFGNMSAH